MTISRLARSSSVANSRARPYSSTAARTTVGSARKLLSTYSKDPPSFATATNTTSRSDCTSLEACSITLRLSPADVVFAKAFNTKRRSARNASSACLRASPFCATAARTTSSSAAKGSAACLSASPVSRTAARTMSRSARKLSAAYSSASPSRETAVSTSSRSACNSSAAYCNAQSPRTGETYPSAISSRLSCGPISLPGAFRLVFTASSTTSLSACKSSTAYWSASPCCLTTLRMNPRSASNDSSAYCNAELACVAAARTTSSSARKASSALSNAFPSLATAASTTALSLCRLAAAESSARPFFSTAASTTVRSAFKSSCA
mmetsp:Transcript_120114/g.339912  ORF Transcript_120114/g.339912 Transcript_120114/m.339912 type:complete len:322 (+) Transcript_120114:867-1832(+)